MWFPVLVALVLAPFGVWGWHQVDKARSEASHGRALKAMQDESSRLQTAAYGLGKRDGEASVREEQDAEQRKTAEALHHMEAELERLRANADKPAGEPTLPADLIAECKRSASCRERRSLK